MSEQCTNCSDQTEQPVEHHTSYEQDETVTVCPKCHRTIHRNPNHELYPEDKPHDGDGKVDITVGIPSDHAQIIDTLSRVTGKPKTAVTRNLIEDGIENGRYMDKLVTMAVGSITEKELWSIICEFDECDWSDCANSEDDARFLARHHAERHHVRAAIRDDPEMQDHGNWKQLMYGVGKSVKYKLEER